MRSDFVVILQPIRCGAAGLEDGHEPVHVEEFVSDLAVKRLDRPVLRRFTGRDEMQLDLALGTPSQHCVAREPLLAVQAVLVVRAPAQMARTAQVVALRSARAAIPPALPQAAEQVAAEHPPALAGADLRLMATVQAPQERTIRAVAHCEDMWVAQAHATLGPAA